MCSLVNRKILPSLATIDGGRERATIIYGMYIPRRYNQPQYYRQPTFDAVIENTHGVGAYIECADAGNYLCRGGGVEVGKRGICLAKCLWAVFRFTRECLPRRDVRITKWITRTQVKTRFNTRGILVVHIFIELRILLSR